MGIYCSLYVGSTDFSWKGIIPDFVALLFAPSDYIASLDEDEEWCNHKFVSSCSEGAKQLRTIGISLDFLRELHFNYFAFDFEEFREDLNYRCEQYLRKKFGESPDYNKRVERMVELCIALYFKKLDEDEEFSKILGAHQCKSNPQEHLKEIQNRVASQLQNPPQQKQKLDLVDFSRSYLLEFLREDPYLSDDRNWLGTGSPDLDLLYSIGLSIFASEPDVPIEFEFSEFIDSSSPMNPDEVKKFHADLLSEIQKRTAHTALAFAQVSSLGNSIGVATSAFEVTTFQTAKAKGDLLEEIATNIFDSEPGFAVKQNVKRRGEEIDLMIVNKLADPFWTALQSPIILIECKNQKKKVEPKDLRNFEVKVLDRKALCRLGIIISVSGFTRGCYEIATRCSRDGYRIILIDNKLLQRRLDSELTTTAWLEEIILEQC